MAELQKFTPDESERNGFAALLEEEIAQLVKTFHTTPSKDITLPVGMHDKVVMNLFVRPGINDENDPQVGIEWIGKDQSVHYILDLYIIRDGGEYHGELRGGTSLTYFDQGRSGDLRMHEERRFFDEVLLQGVASGLERKILHRVIPKSDEDTNNLSENGYTKSFLPGNVFEKMFYPLPRKLT